MRTVCLVALMCTSLVALDYAQTRSADFAQDTVGQPPSGFEFGHTGQVGSPGKWVGVWTKADSVTYFDDLTVATR